MRLCSFSNVSGLAIVSVLAIMCAQFADAGGPAPVGICGAEEAFIEFTDLSVLPFGGEFIGVTTLTGEIVNTRVDVTFTAPEKFEAGLVTFALQLPTGTWGLSGFQLGWSGSGTFVASLDTQLLNGTLAPPDGAGFSTWFFFPSGQGQFGGVFDSLTYTFEWAACPSGDLTHDGAVDGVDLGVLLANWSIPPGSPGCDGAKDCPADINGDGVVDGLDLGILLANWGSFCPTCS